MKFESPGGHYPTLEATNLNFTLGKDPYVEIEHVHEGGVLMDPIRGDFLRTAHSTPQVCKLEKFLEKNGFL